jgi:hydrogenase large subunit
MRALMVETRDFVQQVYYPDMVAIASAYKEWFKYGRGVVNYLAVPEMAEDTKNTKFALPGAIIANGDVKGARVITNHQDLDLIANIKENVAHAWYEGNGTLHPWEGETKPKYTDFQDNGKYSWCKAPRLNGKPVQVGPPAQLLAAYAGGNAKVKKLVDDTCRKIGVGVNDLHSTMGRLGARAVRAHLMADYSLEYLDKLVENVGKGDKVYANHTEIPKGDFKGVGFHEAPRGTLSHWIVIENRKIKNYQAVVPSTWNASPRDDKGVLGPYEASLVGNPVAQADKPLEVLRTIHSFDPCIACAVHTIDPEGKEITKVKVM